MTVRYLIPLALAALALGQTRCHEPDELVALPPGCDTLSYAQDIAPIMDAYCVGCHGPDAQGGGLRLERYDQVAPLARNGRLVGAVDHAPGYAPMPPHFQLAAGQRDLIRAWAQCVAADVPAQ